MPFSLFSFKVSRYIYLLPEYLFILVKAGYSEKNATFVKNHFVYTRMVNHGIGRQNVDNFRKPRITALSLRDFLFVN